VCAGVIDLLRLIGVQNLGDEAPSFVHSAPLRARLFISAEKSPNSSLSVSGQNTGFYWSKSNADGCDPRSADLRRRRATNTRKWQDIENTPKVWDSILGVTAINL
jgi:hypothetical protein